MADKNKEELIRKVSALVERNFGGDYEKAFANYASKAEKDGKVSRKELLQMLSDAKIGNMLTRDAWASGIIKELDKDGDGKISSREFQSVFKD